MKFQKIRLSMLYIGVLLARPKEAAEAVNHAETTEELDRYIKDIAAGKLPDYKDKK